MLSSDSNEAILGRKAPHAHLFVKVEDDRFGLLDPATL